MIFPPARKPKGFHHHFIYVDERKDYLKKIEQQAKKELQTGNTEYQKEDLKATFKSPIKLNRKEKETYNYSHQTGCVILITLLLLTTIFLLFF